MVAPATVKTLEFNTGGPGVSTTSSRVTKTGETEFWMQGRPTCWASSLVGSTTSARMWQTTRCNRACRDRVTCATRTLPVVTALARSLYSYTHLYHGDDKGQCFPTARWGRNTEVARLIATSAYQKPTVCTLQEGRNHSCLDWKEGKAQVNSMPEYTASPRSPGQRRRQDCLRPKLIVRNPSRSSLVWCAVGAPQPQLLHWSSDSPGMAASRSSPHHLPRAAVPGK